jgi:FKBP-type peptidyl-prolyl cis-trans isomerase 2
MTQRFRQDGSGLSSLYQIPILLIAIAVSLGAFWVFYVQQPPASSTPHTAEPGDTVTIEYIGTFEDTGRVFDTSRESVARDNVSYAKAVSFSWRANWQPFTFQVGSGSAIKGFDTGVRGMSVGQTKRIVVPPADGYGPLDMTKVFERPLVQEVPARVVMNDTAFTEKYGTRAVNGLIVIDPFWNWNATASVTNDIVTVTNSPAIGQRVRPYDAWNAVVESIDDSANNGTGIVYVHHLLGPDDGGNVLGHDSGQVFIVSSVDLARGVYVVNFNNEVVGRTLVFDVTLASLIRT